MIATGKDSKSTPNINDKEPINFPKPDLGT